MAQKSSKKAPKEKEMMDATPVIQKTPVKGKTTQKSTDVEMELDDSLERKAKSKGKTPKRQSQI